MLEKTTDLSNSAAPAKPNRPDSFLRRLSSKGRSARSRWTFLLALVAAFVCSETVLQLSADDSNVPPRLLGELKNIPAATLSDAVDEVVGRRGFMSYDMRPVNLKKRMAGRAKTALFGPSGEKTKPKNRGPLSAVQIIDESGPGDILVVVTGDLNVTGLGGLMATTAKVRGWRASWSTERSGTSMKSRRSVCRCSHAASAPRRCWADPRVSCATCPSSAVG